MKPSERTASPPSEREVFLAAVERATPSERDAYLAHACAGDASLRAAVDAILISLAIRY